jgi:hypothetical protein
MSKFHNFWLNQIKEKSKASFVAWEQENSNLRLKIVINGKSKYLSLTGGFDGVNIETYTSLIKQLTE